MVLGSTLECLGVVEFQQLDITSTIAIKRGAAWLNLLSQVLPESVQVLFFFSTSLWQQADTNRVGRINVLGASKHRLATRSTMAIPCLEQASASLE